MLLDMDKHPPQAETDVHIDVKNERKEYRTDTLNIDSLDKEPLKQFAKWFEEAKKVEKAVEVNQMGVSTIGLDGAPNSRYVLLKEVSEGGFVFFTNYESQKGQEIAKDNRVALLFYWPTLNWQVRVKGVASKISEKESDDYFKERPPKSRAGATLSRQSQVISADKKELVDKVASMASQIESGELDLKRPAYWGGYRVMPNSFEFWQGERSRIHDRFVYTPQGDSWSIHRLSP